MNSQQTSETGPLELAGQKAAIRGMFDSISHRYDFLNVFLSSGIQYIWRRRFLREIVEGSPETALDLCCGTGSMTYPALLRGIKVCSIDFSRAMIEQGIKKGRIEAAVIADSSVLPLKDTVYDSVYTAFGIRNLPDYSSTMSEVLRVLKPGGRFHILELTRPSSKTLSSVYGFYLRRILPLVAGILSGRMEAYRYLAGSVSNFASPDELASKMKNAGFKRVDIIPMTGGIATIMSGVKSE